MFAEPIYVKAYQRGVFAAAKAFCDRYSSGERPAAEWPFPKSEALAFVEDLAPADEVRLLRRLGALAYAGARNEWRLLNYALRRRSGIFLVPGARRTGMRNVRER
jgi:hypothetical protein